MWARLDGKSQVEYLNDAMRRDRARELGQSLLLDPQVVWPAPLERLKTSLAEMMAP